MTSPRQALQARGIYEEALLAGWTEQAAHWRYPLMNAIGEIIAEREKRYPFVDTAKHKAKVRWHPSKPANPDSQWYILPKGYTAIKQSGVMYICNGEPSVLAMHAGGVDNVGSTTLSEIAFPKEAVKFLKGIGVNRIIYLADKDAAGLKSAIIWRDALAGSGIDFEVMQWPASLPNKADANDAFISVDFNPSLFQAMLKWLEPLALPAPEIKAPKLETDFSKTPQGMIDTIAAHFGITQWDSDGFSRKNVLCPFHDDSVGNESAGFNHISGVLNCFACGSHSPKEVAERIGINWKAFYPQKEKAIKPSRKREATAKPELSIESLETPDYAAMARPFGDIVPMTAYDLSRFHSVAPIGFIDQADIPAPWVTALLHLTHAKSATVLMVILLHRALRAGKINGDGFTINDFMKALGFARPSSQSALDTMCFLHFLMILDTKYLDTTTEGTEPLKKSKGRKAIVYAVQPNVETIIDTIISVLEPALLERLTEGELVPAAPSVRDSLDLPFAEWKTWHEKINNYRHERTLELINKILCSVLEGRADYNFTDKDLQSPAHLRAKLLNIELAPHSTDREYTDKNTGEVVSIPKGIQLSKQYLALALGCSVASVSNLYALGNIGHERIKGWHEVERPNACDILKELREAPSSLNKELSGYSVGMSMKVYDNGQETWLKLIYGEAAINRFHAWDGRIVKLHILVEQPSLLWNMNTEEIAEKQAKEAIEERQALDSAESPEEKEIVQKKIEKQAEKKPRKPSFVSGGDRTYKGHSPEWLRERVVGTWVHCYTPYRLAGVLYAVNGIQAKGLSYNEFPHLQLAVVDNEGIAIELFKSLGEVIIWLNRNAEKKQVRSVESYGTLDEIEVIEAPTPVVVIPESPKVISKPIVKQAPKPAANWDGWCWANNDDEFQRRMKAIGG